MSSAPSKRFSVEMAWSLGTAPRFSIGISPSNASADRLAGMSVARSLSAFVPHDLTAPLSGAGAGPLAGLSAAIKDLYDVAGYRTGGGGPGWLLAHAWAPPTAPPRRRLLEGRATNFVDLNYQGHYLISVRAS